MSFKPQKLMQYLRAACCAAAVVVIAGCTASASSGVATVNIERITAHWDKFSDYERQLRDESQRITASRVSDGERRRQLQALHDKYAALQSEITTDVRQAADRVAEAQGLHLIVTREFVGYGGADITSDIERELKIVETAPAVSQTPSMPLKPPVY